MVLAYPHPSALWAPASTTLGESLVNGAPTPPPGTRFVDEADRGAPFEPEGALRGRITFDQMIDYHQPSEDQFTLVRDFERRIVAATCFTVRAEDVIADYLARNALFRSATPVRGGKALVEALVLFARARGKSFLRLDSVNDQRSLAWYEKLGFVHDGPPREDPVWGALFPFVLPL
jgi:GNAT superfamily N-acetyltransferase